MSIDVTLQALADPTRRGVVELLGQGPQRAGELADALQMSRPAMSRHLKILRTAGLVNAVSSTNDGRVREYHLQSQRLGELTDWARDVSAFWEQSLDSFARHVEGSDDP